MSVDLEALVTFIGSEMAIEPPPVFMDEEGHVVDAGPSAWILTLAGQDGLLLRDIYSARRLDLPLRHVLETRPARWQPKQRGAAMLVLDVLVMFRGESVTLGPYRTDG